MVRRHGSAGLGWLAVAVGALWLGASCGLIIGIDDVRLADAGAGDGSTADGPRDDAASPTDAVPPRDGSCDASLGSDPNNCGWCGNVCTSPEHATATCKSGACSFDCWSGHALCQSTCIDTASDGLNCGSCGHDCLGGDCVAGVCQPVVLASGRSEPFGIAVGGGYVFWTEQTAGNVMKVSLAPTGGPAPSPDTVASGQTQPTGITVMGARAYWTNKGTAGGTDGAVRWCDISGPGVGYVAAGETSPTGITTYGSSLLWTGQSAAAGGIIRMSDPAGDPVTLAAAENSPSGIAVAGGFVYWVNSTSAGAVRRLQLEQGSPETVAGDQGNPINIAVDGDEVYFTNYVANQVMHVTAGGSPQSIYNPPPIGRAYGIAVDPDFVYWTEYADLAAGGGAVRKQPRAGGSTQTLATQQDGPWGLAIDDSSIYWVNKDGGEVLRLAK